ncbi:MAG: selenocysteine-specific translation elongation factor, partial [Hyphomicrobiales bacterium]|nr:selenocysteine-specific translation elongation factor [Hyphomicrobiales bacterium]
GFVDVPGHERFVRNMIAGVSGIDHALVVVAADDGVMPQTREHVAILDLLGISGGVVALTKIDRADPARIAEVSAEIADLLAETELADSPVFPVSSVTGEGIEALRAHLLAAADELQSARAAGAFRMSVDRSFIVEGAGIVATGLVLSGEASVNDRVLISPSGIEVRIRSIHAQNRKSDLGRAGERCALNISAPRLTLNDIGRGDWLLDAGLHAPVQRFDARIRLLASEDRPLRHWTPVHLHIGAADVPARVAVLQSGDSASVIKPGAEGFVQIVLQQPVSALHGDRFVLRDQSALRTIAGGAVIDPFAPDRGRARPDRLALVAALERGHLVASLASALASAPDGLAFGLFCQARNVLPQDCDPALQSLKAVVVGGGRDAIAVTLQRRDGMLGEIKQAVAREQEANPASPGLALPALQKALARRIKPPLLPYLLDMLGKAGDLQLVAGAWRVAGVGRQLDASDAALWSRIEPLLDDETLRPPSVAEIATALNQTPRGVERTLNRAARIGLVCQVADNRYYLPPHLQRLGEIAEATAKADADSMLQVRAFRDASGIGRNLVIEVLEHFDRLGFTHRSGDHRRILKPASDVAWVRVHA